MKKRGLWISMISIAATLVVGVGVAFAAWSVINLQSAENEVTVGNPINVSVSGTAMSGTIQPGKADSTATATFTVSLTGAETAYALKLTTVTFTPASGALTFADMDEGEWEYKFGEGNWTALTGETPLEATATAGEKTISIRATNALDEGAAGGVLSFFVELV